MYRLGGFLGGGRTTSGGGLTAELAVKHGDGVRIGVVGAGVFGSYHADKFSKRNDAALVGIFDVDVERAAKLAGCFGVRAFPEFHELLENVDGVVIAAPATQHYALAQQALAARRHLLVEKPLAISVAQADALTNQAAANGIVLQVGHQERYVCEAVGLLPNDETPVRIDCVRRVPRTGRCEDVSVAFDLMVHDIDIVQQLTKSDIARIRAAGGRDEITAELELENDVAVSICACRNAKYPERKIAIVFEGRTVEFDFAKKTMTDQGGEKRLNGAGASEALLALRDPLAYGAGLFVSAIRGAASSFVTGADGRACIDWAAQIEAAAGLSSLAHVEPRERVEA